MLHGLNVVLKWAKANRGTPKRNWEFMCVMLLQNMETLMTAVIGL